MYIGDPMTFCAAYTGGYVQVATVLVGIAAMLAISWYGHKWLGGTK